MSAAATTTVAQAAFAFGALACFWATLDGSMRIVRQSAPYWLPFAPMLLVLHGILNPAFPPSNAGKVILIRPDGFWYAFLVTLRIGLMTLAAACWVSVSRSQVARFVLARAWMPAGVALALLQVSTLVKLFSLRAGQVVLAQRSRGVPVDGTLLQRARNLPAAVIPLAIGIMMDADERSTALANRGVAVLDGRFPQEERRTISGVEMLAWILLFAVLTAVIILAPPK